MRTFSLIRTTQQSHFFSLLFLFVMGSWSHSFAQPSNSVYLEIGGVAGHYSINYEQLIAQSDYTRFYASIGFSHSLLNRKGFSPRIPLQLKFGFPVTRGLELEIGGGLTPYWFTSETRGYSSWTGPYSYKSRDFIPYWSGRVGIRQSLGSGSYLGCYYTPVFEGITNSQRTIRWAAVTVGVKL